MYVSYRSRWYSVFNACTLSLGDVLTICLYICICSTNSCMLFFVASSSSRSCVERWFNIFFCVVHLDTYALLLEVFKLAVQNRWLYLHMYICILGSWERVPTLKRAPTPYNFLHRVKVYSNEHPSWSELCVANEAYLWKRCLERYAYLR